MALARLWAFLAMQSVCCSGSPSEDRRLRVVPFFKASANFDFKNRSTVKAATKLRVRSVYNSRPAVLHSGDSLHTLCELLRTKEKVGIVNAASSQHVCGGFFANTGKGTQEEFLASITCGLGTSLLHFADMENGRYKKERDGKINYREGVYKNKILCSDGMCLKIRMQAHRDYLEVKSRYRFFSDYAVDESLGFLTNTNYRFTVYSVSAFDSRGASVVEYERLYRDTYDQLATVLIDARLRKIRHMVLTVPGSGVFSGGNKRYRRKVMKAAEDVAAEHGFGLETIVICS